MTSKRTRAMGQHLLVDNNIADAIVAHAGLKETDTVLEIGPGKGVLTARMAPIAKKIIVIEKDRDFIPALNAIGNNVEVLCGDAVELDFPPFNIVVSNLPYVISSPITFKLLKTAFDRGVIMYQKEFAQRMCAPVCSPHYSRLSVEVYRRARCRMLMKIPPSAFAPHPKVQSAVIEIIPRPCPFMIENGERYSDIVRALFSHRRKSVRNALISERTKLSIGTLDGKDPVMSRKAETLSPEEIAALVTLLDV